MRYTKRGQRLSSFFVSIFILALMGAGLTGPYSIASAAQAKPIELKFAEDEPAQSLFCQTRFWWAEEIAKRTNGRLKIKIYPASTLANGRNAIDAVRARLADGGKAVSVFHPGKTPLSTVSQNPLGSTDLYAGNMAIQDLMFNYKPLIQEWAKFNQIPLWNSPTGSQNLIANRPLTDLSQLKGLKIRASAQNADVVAILGGTPVFIPMPETYEALQRATADGAMAGLAHMKPLRFWEVCKHLLMFGNNGISACGFGTLNLDVWKSLPKDAQKVVLDVSKEFTAYLAERQIELEKNVLDEFRTAGVKIYTLNDEDKKAFSAACETVSRKWAKDLDDKGLPGTEILDLFLKKTAEYEAEVKAQGYPWAKK